MSWLFITMDQRWQQSWHRKNEGNYWGLLSLWFERVKIMPFESNWNWIVGVQMQNIKQEIKHLPNEISRGIVKNYGFIDFYCYLRRLNLRMCLINWILNYKKIEKNLEEKWINLNKLKLLLNCFLFILINTLINLFNKKDWIFSYKGLLNFKNINILSVYLNH